MTYVGPSQVLVKPLNTEADNQPSHGVILKSQYGHEIEDVRVMGEDRYLIGRTRDTLLLGKDFIHNLMVLYYIRIYTYTKIHVHIYLGHMCCSK